MKPTQPHERYALLDILRGFALAGVLVANMSSHSGYFFLSPDKIAALDYAAVGDDLMWIIHFITDGKFYSIFSILFGIGFALQMKRAQEKGAHFSSRFVRRLLILLIFGLLHAVFFYVGDILVLYALVGMVLLLFRNASDKFIIRSAFLFIILPVVQYLFFWIEARMTNVPVAAFDYALFNRIVDVYQTGNFTEIVQINIGGLLFGRYPDLLFTGRIFKVLGMFLLGFYITRKMIFADIDKFTPYLKKVVLFGLIIGIPSNVVLAFMMETDVYYALRGSGILQPIVYAIGVPALALAYAAGIALLYQKVKWKKGLQFFAPVGQMALTNYIMQSIICCFIFMSYGLGLFGHLGPVEFAIIGLFIYAFQVAFSAWWLSYFNHGLLEWIWRLLTYRKIQPILKHKVDVNVGA